MAVKSEKEKKKRKSIRRWKADAGGVIEKAGGGSPWHAETTARLPGQFYSPAVSHLSHQPPPTLNLASSLCLHLFCVSVQRREKPSGEELVPNVAGQAVCEAQTRGVGGCEQKKSHCGWLHLDFSAAPPFCLKERHSSHQPKHPRGQNKTHGHVDCVSRLRVKVISPLQVAAKAVRWNCYWQIAPQHQKVMLSIQVEDMCILPGLDLDTME